MSVLDEMRQLADLVARTELPAPHGLHFDYPALDEAWVRRIAADESIAGKVGLVPQTVIGPYRTFGGVEGVQVRLSWRWDGRHPDRERMAAALRTLADLVASADMPPPARVDAMHAVFEVGGPARAEVCRAALLLGEWPTTLQGSTWVLKCIGSVSYTVHGFLS